MPRKSQRRIAVAVIAACALAALLAQGNAGSAIGDDGPRAAHSRTVHDLAGADARVKY